MNLSTIQTELVACALCEADGKNPDEDVATGELQTVRVGHASLVQRAVTMKAWQSYENEARKFIVAARAMEQWSKTLTMFRSLVQQDDSIRLA